MTLSTNGTTSKPDLQLFQNADFDPCHDLYTPHLIALNKIVVDSKEPLEGNLFYYNLEEPVLDTPDPRYQHKRYNWGFFVLGGSRLLEVGFNAGHSALLALTNNPDLIYVGVDIAYHSYTVPCYQYLKSVFGDRIQLHVGDSRKAVPAVADFLRFDLFHIDGGHDMAVAEADLFNITSRAAPGSRLLFDDITGPLLRILCDHYLVKGLMSEFRPAIWKGEDQALFRINERPGASRG